MGKLSNSPSRYSVQADKSTLYDQVYTKFGDQNPKQAKVEAADLWRCMCSGSRGEGSQPAS